jgi:NADH-quinone oxidoreductase subunit J
MLLGAEKLKDEGTSKKTRYLAIVLAVVFLGEAAWLLVFQSGVSPLGLNMPVSDFASPTQIGLVLFSNYLLPFEITSAILLVAVIGAIVLTKTDAPTPKPISGGKE